MQDAHNFVEAVTKIANAQASEQMELQATLMKEYSNEVAKRGAEEAQMSITNGYMMMEYDDFQSTMYAKIGLKRGTH